MLYNVPLYFLELFNPSKRYFWPFLLHKDGFVYTKAAFLRYEAVACKTPLIFRIACATRKGHALLQVIPSTTSIK